MRDAAEVQTGFAKPGAGEVLARAMAGESLDDIREQEQNKDTGESSPQKSAENAAPTNDQETDPGIDPEGGESPAPEIDYKQAIPMPGREPIPLGELKDLAQKALDEQETVSLLDEQQRESRQYLAKLQNDLEGVANLLHQQGLLKPEVIETFRNVYRQQVAMNKRRLVTLIPSWSKPETQTADLEIIKQFMAGYGIEPEYAESLSDGRPEFVWMIQDVARAWHKAQSVLAGKKAPATRKGNANKPGAKQKREQMKKEAFTAINSGNFEQGKAGLGQILLDAQKKGR